MKICKECNSEKALEDFPKQKQNSDGRLGICKECRNKRTRIASLKSYHKNREKRLEANRERKLLEPEKRKEYDKRYREKHKQEIIDQKTRYNCRTIYKCTIGEYQERMDTSNACEICGKENDLCYDHNHETLEFRGVLCKGCNRSIGQLGDTKESIERVLKYFNKL